MRMIKFEKLRKIIFVDEDKRLRVGGSTLKVQVCNLKRTTMAACRNYLT